MKRNMINWSVGKKLLGVFILLFCVTIVFAQSPDKRSWKQRLDKQKKEQAVCETSLLLKEIGLKQKGDALICATTNQVLTLEEVHTRFSKHTSSLILSSSSASSSETKKEQLTYVTRLNAMVHNVAYPTTSITTSNMLAATVAKEQLRIIDAWCANRQDAEIEAKLHYQLLQRIATIF